MVPTAAMSGAQHKQLEQGEGTTHYPAQLGFSDKVVQSKGWLSVT